MIGRVNVVFFFQHRMFGQVSAALEAAAAAGTRPRVERLMK